MSSERGILTLRTSELLLMTLKRPTVKPEAQKAGSHDGRLVHRGLKSVGILTGFRMEENAEAVPSDKRDVIKRQQ